VVAYLRKSLRYFVPFLGLEHDGKWEETVGFAPDRVGDKQKVEFLLYGQAESKVYQRLHLMVDVQ